MDKKYAGPKISVFLACSLDGYIATEEGKLDWLEGVHMVEEDFGLRSFLFGIDTIVMGRKTYELVNSFSIWPYEGKRVVVLSSTLETVRPEAELANLEVDTLVEKLTEEGSKSIWVDGGETIAAFLYRGLVDQMTLSTIPVILGKGIPLFHEMNRSFSCRLLSTHTYESGLVQNVYSVLKQNIDG